MIVIRKKEFSNKEQKELRDKLDIEAGKKLVRKATWDKILSLGKDEGLEELTYDSFKANANEFNHNPKMMNFINMEPSNLQEILSKIKDFRSGMKDVSNATYKHIGRKLNK